MNEISSYLVRIYRRDGQTMAGLVEQVKSGRTAPFLNGAQLIELLEGRRRFARRRIRRLHTGPGTATPAATERETT